jgi:hypothetical protein
VVCSRAADYDRQQSRLRLQNAVVIQPLEAAQVDAYFKAAGKSLSGVRSILRKNAELRELVSTPLMLHVQSRKGIYEYKYNGNPEYTSAGKYSTSILVYTNRFSPRRSG